MRDEKRDSNVLISHINKPRAKLLIATGISLVTRRLGGPAHQRHDVKSGSEISDHGQWQISRLFNWSIVSKV